MGTLQGKFSTGPTPSPPVGVYTSRAWHASRGAAATGTGSTGEAGHGSSLATGHAGNGDRDFCVLNGLGGY